MQTKANKYFIIILVVLFMVNAITGWMYYSDYQKSKKLVNNIEESLATEIGNLKGMLKLMIEEEDYSENLVIRWAEMQTSTEKILQSISYRTDYKNMTKEEHQNLSGMESTFVSLLYFFRHTRHTLSREYIYEPASCDGVSISSDEDINKRLNDYYQLFDDFDPVNQSYVELVNGWDEKQAYQVNSCSNW